MSLLALDEVTLHLGRRTLFDHIALAVERGDHLGLVGPNGSGKSTLLRVVVGQIVPDGGRVVFAKGARLGYLPQELSELGEGTLLEQVLSAAPGRNDVETRLTEVEDALGTSNDEAEQLELAEELADLHRRLVDLEQDYAPHKAQSILSGLGFKTRDFDRPVSEFSGGWRMRAALAGLLFQKPDVLLLDEPTNHLDMPSVAWLNKFLASYTEAFVLICHDREFLNRHVNRIASFEVEGLRTYKGNYSSYVEQRRLELELLDNKVKKDEARKRELEAFVTRFKAKASKARQAQSKAKQIERMQEDMVEIPKPRQTISIRFPSAERTGDNVLRLSGVGFSYGAHRVFSGADLLVRRGDKVAIVGVNGAGKTTLLKIIAGELAGYEGKIEPGSRVKMSYFAQHHAEVLDRSHTVLEEVGQAAPKKGQTELRGLLGAFLFSGDEVEKPIGVLSGGERARVALAKLLVDPGNVLLLDEPTNHLDTESAERLTESLEGYDGTLIFVSHNLDFAKRLSTKVWDVHDGVVETYPGSLADYIEQFSGADETPKAPEPKAVAPKPTAMSREQNKKDQAEQRKRRTNLEKEIADAEARIARLEAEQNELEARLAHPSTQANAEEARTVAKRYEEVQRESAQLLARWEKASSELAGL